MIRINLLPEEFRRSERTSMKLFAAMLAAVVLVCSGLGWFGLVWFGELAQLEEEKTAVEETLSQKKERAAYADALESEKKDYESRSETIQNICRSRMNWTEVLDQVIDVVNNDGNTERHMAWFRSMAARESSEAGLGAAVQMPGYVQGRELRKVADFHEDLEHAPFFTDVHSKSPPAGSVELDQKRNPPEAMAFDMKFSFKTPKEWVRNKKQPAKPAGK